MFLKICDRQMFRIYFIIATRPTEYVLPLLDMRENPDGINGLNLAEIKQMAFQQQDKRFENEVEASLVNEMEQCINVLDFSDLPPLSDINGRIKPRIHIRNASGRRQSYIKQCERANECSCM